MLPKNLRLKTSSEFSATYRIKKSVANSLLILYAGKEHFNGAPTKVGIAVSKKFHKRAVKRNRIKRLIREAYRVGLKNGEIKDRQKFKSYIFLPRNSALDASYKQVYDAVIHIIERANNKF